MADNTGLFKKLAAVRQAVGVVKKDGYNNFNKFDYQSVGAINTAIRSALNENGVMLFSECTGVEIVFGNETKEHFANCKYQYTFVDIDTGQAQVLSWAQSAPLANNKAVVDDKAVGKIHSYAQKYFLIRTFLVTTQEDVDSDLDGSDGMSGSQPTQRQAPSNVQTMPQDEDSGTTEPTNVVVTKIGKGDKPYLVIEGITFFTRDPLREMGFDVDGLDKPGVHNLSDKIQIVWKLDGNGYKKPLRLRHNGTGHIYYMPEAS